MQDAEKTWELILWTGGGKALSSEQTGFNVNEQIGSPDYRDANSTTVEQGRTALSCATCRNR